jgi:hypothetical protein
MNYNYWHNQTAIGYLRYALDHYNNKVSENPDNECRKLTDVETRRIIGCLYYAFDMKTMEQAHDIAVRL